MRATVVLVDRAGRPRELTVEWAGAATVGQLLAAGGLPADGAVSLDGFFFGPESPLDLAGLHDGMTISLSSRHARPSRVDVAGELHVAVTAGTGAGTMVPVRSGDTYIGSDPTCELVLRNAAVAPRHALVHLEPDGSLELLPLTDPVSLDGAPVSDRVPLAPGAAVGIGRTALEVRPGQIPDAVADRVDNFMEIRRPPRLRPPVPETVLRWPVEPDPPTRQPIPWAALIAPIALGVALYFVTRTLFMLLFIGLTPIMAGVNFVTSHRSGKSHYRRSMAEYRRALAEAEDGLDAALRQERQLRFEAAPDAGRIAATALGPRRALWERRRRDDDFLHCRIGLATLPATIRRVPAQAYASTDLEPVNLNDVPVVLSLQDMGVLGVAGGPEFTRAVAGWLLAQAAVASGPADLQIVVLAGDSAADESRWSWARWLPHTLSPLPGGPPLFGTNTETVEARIAELVSVVQARHGHEGPGQQVRLRSTDWPHILVVFDPAYEIRRLPGVDIILREGPAVGVHSICVESIDSYLPVECRAVVTAASDGTASLAMANRPVQSGIVIDEPGPELLAAVGRSLAPLRDPDAVTAAGTIPTSVRLVDLLDLERLDASGLLDVWARSRRSTVATVGAGASGPYSVDLRIDGPHGLVAGTTGAGKSEFLQTLIASLAVANRHDAMCFLLVDYKGGSAFRDCGRLPHTVGVVTDLDGHLTARALESLTAELRRREELLARGGAKDIDDYIAMGEPVGSLPRLLIVIDEFAGLVAELPDFVTGLVGIAQRGRSLGIHLILATQRPSGVVSPEIRANTNLRVALRVTSPVESADVIDAPDAARIMPATPGRAYARTGHSALTLFQSARVGGPASPAVSERGPEIAVADAGWAAAGYAPRLARIGTSGNVDPADTDLARLATVLTEAAERSGIPQQSQPWLPALPPVIALSGIVGDVWSDRSASGPSDDGIVAAPFAVVDLPSAQQQLTLSYHPGSDRHLAIAGGPGSGRTSALRTFAVSMASLNHPDDLWIYAIDCGGGELRRLVQLPHTGAVVTRTEIERTSRLLTRINDEMHRRLDQLAAEGYTDVAEQRANAAPDKRMPYIVVLVDRWEGFMSTFDPVDNQRLTDLIVDIAREGGGAGIRLIVTGDRTVLSGRLIAAIDDRLCLSLPDRADYAFAGLDARKVPDPMGPGRGVRSGDVAELQFAVAGADPSGPSQAAAITKLVHEWRDRQESWVDGRRPFRVDTLPVEVDELAAREMVPRGAVTPHTALIGVGGDELGAITMDLSVMGGFVVAGPRRSGRSNTLTVMARSLIDNGCTVVAFCPRPSPVRLLRGLPGVAGMFDGDDPSAQDALEVLNQVEGPLAVLVDDATALHGAPVAELLGHVAAEGPQQGHVLVIAGVAEELMRPMRGFIYQTVQNHSGMLLCPEHTTDGDLLGAHLPRSAVFRQPPGRAILLSGPQPMTIQVPKAKDAA